ncbi:TetR/AcrR family transcriptional regulator [Alteromonas sp. C1M14]|uniref:TetR/AcrR family transcriptional regulator n=1 Tax=Alteromonas sp. C1M14 TaxID=2841567 RepID=UPI001C088AAC|nr:TetR/AcrR family transcriptional regulator [Alteromonas sp. C1M14]
MEKKAHIVKVAFELFYQYGVHDVGINRIIADAGIAKKTLYHHFDSKEALVAATIAYRDECYFSYLTKRLETIPSGLEAINTLFDSLNDLIYEKQPENGEFFGCYFINVSAQFSSQDNHLHKQCAQSKQKMLNLIQHHVSHILDKETAIITMTDAIGLLFEGAIVQAYVLGDKQAAAKAKAIAAGLLEQKAAA